MLRYEYKQLEQEVYMPAGDVAGTYAKELALGKVHGLRSVELKLRESIVALQTKIKESRQDNT